MTNYVKIPGFVAENISQELADKLKNYISGGGGMA